MQLHNPASELDLISKWKWKSPVITILWEMKVISSKYANNSMKNVEFVNPEIMNILRVILFILTEQSMCSKWV